ncbi:hypothetical protein GCM10027612_07260 [Microbispora bryophytorum subsp. camponoti]
MELPFLNWLYTAVAQVITWIHAGYSTFIPSSSGLNWALTIITLTVLMRLLIFPLFMKQMRSSRKMQELAPKVQELRKKYKNDKQRMNQEVMRLYQEGAPTHSGAASRSSRSSRSSSRCSPCCGPSPRTGSRSGWTRR